MTRSTRKLPVATTRVLLALFALLVGYAGCAAPVAPVAAPTVTRQAGEHALADQRRPTAGSGAHKGPWNSPDFAHFRDAIEDYRPLVTPSNQRAIGTAVVPYALYLNEMHRLIHPIFADSFLDSLDQLPGSHPLNDASLVVTLELVIDAQGRLIRRGVIRSSGKTAFDVVALAAIERAAPFGQPPPQIFSSDGNVYIHWEFRRDGMACSTLYAHPFRLAL